MCVWGGEEGSDARACACNNAPTTSTPAPSILDSFQTLRSAARYSLLAQVLTLPLHAEYAASCEFTPRDRLAYSLRRWVYVPPRLVSMSCFERSVGAYARACLGGLSLTPWTGWHCCCAGWVYMSGRIYGLLGPLGPFVPCIYFAAHAPVSLNPSILNPITRSATCPFMLRSPRRPASALRRCWSHARSRQDRWASRVFWWWVGWWVREGAFRGVGQVVGVAAGRTHA